MKHLTEVAWVGGRRKGGRKVKISAGGRRYRSSPHASLARPFPIPSPSDACHAGSTEVFYDNFHEILHGSTINQINSM